MERCRVFPLRLSPINPSGALRNELATRQWIDIFPDREQALRELVETIRNVLHDPSTVEGIAARTVSIAAIHSNAVDEAPAGEPASRGPVIMPGSLQFEAIRALLARYIGPVAKPRARRQAKLADRHR